MTDAINGAINPADAAAANAKVRVGNTEHFAVDLL